MREEHFWFIRSIVDIGHALSSSQTVRQRQQFEVIVSSYCKETGMPSDEERELRDYIANNLNYSTSKSNKISYQVGANR